MDKIMTNKSFEHLVIEVFKKFMATFFNHNMIIHSLIINDEENKNFDNVIFISLFGDIEGAFILEVNNLTVENFLKQVQLSLKEKIDFHQLVKGYIGEFGNILASRIVTNLGKNFGSTFLSTPSLFSGTGMMVDLFYDLTYKADIESEFGIFKISFSHKT